MHKKTIIRLVVMISVLVLFASGCAKKPVVEEQIEPTQIEVTQQQPTQIQDTQIADSAADAAAAAEAAAQAAVRAAEGGLERVYFNFDQYVLTDGAKTALVNNAGLLRAAPSVNIVIEGHCDERGSDEYNLALGQKRAMATKDYLVSLGVAANRMSVISYGEELPLDAARTPEAWAKNRRADFKIKR